MLVDWIKMQFSICTKLNINKINNLKLIHSTNFTTLINSVCVILISQILKWPSPASTCTDRAFQYQIQSESNSSMYENITTF